MTRALAVCGVGAQSCLVWATAWMGNKQMLQKGSDVALSPGEAALCPQPPLMQLLSEPESAVSFFVQVHWFIPDSFFSS